MTTVRRRTTGLMICALATLGMVLAGCEDDSGPSNVAPTATFTAQCTALGCAFTNGSTDPDGTIEAYAWDFGDESTGATTRDASHTYAGAGRFTVTLTVADDAGDSATATAMVDATAPVNPGGGLLVNFSVSCVGAVCEFIDRSAASPTATFQWDFGDGETADTRDASHTYIAGGWYTITLHILDAGTSAVGTQLLEVAGPSPTADFIYTCTELACQFTERTSNPDGGMLAYAWDFGDGATSSERSPSHQFAAAGSYTVALTVTNTRGAVGTTARTFALPAIDWPTADLQISCYESTCSYSTVSTGGVIVAWQWSFGDGSTSTEQSPSHTYLAPGTYPVQVTITDPGGETATLSSEVTVPIPPGVPSFTADCSGPTCTFTNTSTGSILFVTWDFGDGTTSAEWSPIHVYQVTEPRTFRVTLFLCEFDWCLSSASADVFVEP